MCSTWGLVLYRSFSLKKKKKKLHCASAVHQTENVSSNLPHEQGITQHEGLTMAAGADVKRRCRVQGSSCHLVSGRMYAED